MNNLKGKGKGIGEYKDGVIVFLIGILIFIIIGLVIQSNNKTILMNKIAVDTKIALEKLEAPKKLLSSYEVNRKIEINKIEEIDNKIEELNNDIKTFQEAKRMREDLKSDFEKQIRCQRASLSGIEEGDCSVKSVYDLYILHP